MRLHTVTGSSLIHENPECSTMAQLVASALAAKANLSGANLREANLGGANLREANLGGANLREANLYGANFSGANLYGANLGGADLSGAELDRLTAARLSIVPESGAFEGYKKLAYGCIAHLRIPATAQRCNATGRKCRASEAEVLAIWDAKGQPKTMGRSQYRLDFKYTVGEIVRPEGSFNPDRWQECSSGIHFYLTRIEAENHN